MKLINIDFLSCKQITTKDLEILAENMKDLKLLKKASVLAFPHLGNKNFSILLILYNRYHTISNDCVSQFALKISALER